MNNYSQFSRRASWAILIATLLLAFLVFFAIGFASAALALAQHLLTPDHRPFRFDRAFWLVAAVVLPALVLCRFYFVVARKAPSARYTAIGWSASAVYHAALTCLLVFHMPGSVQVSGSPLYLPLSLIS